jgi:UDP:flavonoid glycosyltransferase YjiC (YdhE family)
MVMSLLGFLRDHLEQVIQEGCERSFSSTLAFDYDKAVWDGVTPPRHNVLVIAVGTRGDIDPLIEIGKKLEALHHHTVVFASHEKHRAHIAKGCGGSNMKFVPLAGDPEVLSRFACQWSQYTSLADNLEILESHAVHMRELLQSQWQAAIHDSGHIPDVILSNPVSFMHAHLAESIGCSLHVAFPQPWIPTEAFPHPLFADQVCALPRLLLLPLGGEQKTRSKGVIDVAKMNLLSHSITDRLLWQGL